MIKQASTITEEALMLYRILFDDDLSALIIAISLNFTKTYHYTIILKIQI
jgi:hypothetical protein